MSNRKRSLKITTAAMLLLSLSTLVSCKENTVIRTDVVPAVDNINVFATDTLTLHTKSVLDDTLTTSLFVSGVPVYMGAGAITGDRVMGRLQEYFYFQVRPPQDNYSFDQTKFKVDSAVLVLPYSGYTYGDTSNTAGLQTFNAYRVTGEFSVDSAYKSNSPDRVVDPSPIATAVVDLKGLVRSRYDSTSVLGVKRYPHVRMRLRDDLVTELINNTGTANYTNTTAFLSFFKGIQVRTQNSGNTLPYFLLNGIDMYSTAGVVVYYHTINSGGAINDTLTVSYPFEGSKTGFYNKIIRDLSGTTVQSYLSSTAVSDNMAFITNAPGIAVEIAVPNVAALPNCIVNQAQLILTQIAAPMDGVFYGPQRIYPKGIDANGAAYTIADRYPLSSLNALSFIDGNQRSVNLAGVIVNQYVLNIPRELQRAIAEQKKELRLRLNGIQSYPGACRVTLGGGTYSQPQYRIKLNIVYTKI